MKAVYSRIIAYLIVVLIQTFCYQAIGFLYPHTVYYEPFLVVDQMIPFIPETIWTYSLYYLILVCGILLAFDEEVFPRFIINFIWISIIADLLFILIPVTINTPAIGSNHDTWTTHFFNFLIPLDSRGNCFPSLHCAHSLMITWWFMKSKKYRGWLSNLLIVATILVMISTVTLKKHWFIDVIGGVVLFLIVIKFELRSERREIEAEST